MPYINAPIIIILIITIILLKYVPKFRRVFTFVGRSLYHFIPVDRETFFNKTFIFICIHIKAISGVVEMNIGVEHFLSNHGKKMTRNICCFIHKTQVLNSVNCV